MSEADSGPEQYDQYKVLGDIAKGQHSVVLEVVDTGNSERYAMKLLLPDALKDREQRNSLKHEAQVSQSLEHPNIIRFRELKITKVHAYFTMEMFRAPSLKSQIQTELSSLHVRIKRLIELTGLALGHMHERGWIHRDIKPDNILFSKGSDLRVIDFSLSSRATGGLAALFGGKQKVQGTRTYMSPEQIRGQKLTPQTDVYNFGVTIFELLTGKPPFLGSSPNDLLRKHLSTPAPPPSVNNANVTPEMDRMVVRMLAKKAENRHQSMNELLAEFRSLNVFKEAVEVVAPKKKDEEEESTSLSHRRDSRTDALRAAAQRDSQAGLAPTGQRGAAEKPAAAAVAVVTAAQPAAKAGASAPAVKASVPAAKSATAPAAAPAKPAPAMVPATPPVAAVPVSRPASPVATPAARQAAPRPTAAPAPAAPAPAAGATANVPVSRNPAPAAPPARTRPPSRNPAPLPAARNPQPAPPPEPEPMDDLPGMDDFKIL